MYVIELNTARELLLLIFCISPGSVVAYLRCGGKYLFEKYDKITCSTFTAESNSDRILKIGQHFLSYERISSGTFFMAHGVYTGISRRRKYGHIWRSTGRPSDVEKSSTSKRLPFGPSTTT